MTVERDLTAGLPGPLHGAAWAAGLLRNLYETDRATDRRILAEVTDLPTVARRAGQAGAMLRRTAEDGRGRDVRWLTTQAAIYRGRAQRAADEFARHHERDGRYRSGFTWMWAQVANAYAWAAAHVEDAATGPEEDAAAWMCAAADRFDWLTLSIPHQ
ncbi:hypothetical protein ABZ851_37175 [Streptomyces sp. NPDC047049]|uniref:hypothetical protein n=1 Tax=Streptomyces sp. NPDC047049 TaxID=3156688 RepID=UPI003401F401